MPIQFSGVPANLRVPFVAVEFDSSQAVQGVQIKPWRALLIGQRLAAGSIPELTPTRVFSASDMVAQFGSGSQLYEMGVAWFAQNKFTETWAVALDDDVAGAQATGTATITGPATANHELFFYIAGARLQVPVADGDTATEIAAALVAEVTDDALLPVTAANVAGVVTFTAKHKGVIGNAIDLRVNYNAGETLPLGVGVAIVAMSGGTTTPDLDDVWAALGEVQYDVLALPYSDTTSLGSADVELEDRWGPLRPLDGYAVAGAKGNLGALAAIGSAENSKHISLMGAELSPSSPWSWAAAVAGQLGLSASGDPALPFQTLPLYGISAPAEASLFNLLERNALLFDGISTFTVDPSGLVRINSLVSTYQTNELGAEDESFLYPETHLTLGFLRWSMRNRIALRFPRHKLAGDTETIASGQKVATPSSVRLELIALFTEWQAMGLVEDVAQFKADLVVEINATNKNRLDVLMPPNLINQLRVTAARMEFRL